MDKSALAKERITWIASYPKSGNTWLRSFLQAYRGGGHLDLNDLHTGYGDSGEHYMRPVSALPLADLQVAGQLLLRPAALLNAMAIMPPPRLFKTHFCNLKPEGVPAYIPGEFTERAIYIVRDPRDVLMSVCRHYGLSTPMGVEMMANKDRRIGGGGQTTQIISSWSNHVASWGGEDKYPVHVVRYEDMCSDPVSEFTEVIEFLGWDMDADRIKRSVDAVELSKLRQREDDTGFVENPLHEERGRFFNEGGSRWQDEVGPKWIEQIEKDHGDIMRHMAYLETKVVDINAI